MEEEACDLPSISERFGAKEASWLAVWVQTRHSGVYLAAVSVCVCVCVYVRERQREGGRQRLYVCTHIHKHSEPMLLRAPGAQSWSVDGVVLMAGL